MSKTTEERAKVCIEQFNYPLYESNFVERGYIKGAEEQRKIDIDKACEWIRNNLVNYFADDNLKVSVVNRFRKAMEV